MAHVSKFHTDEEVLAWKDDDEGIQVVRIGSSEPVQGDDSITPSGFRENFQVRLWGRITSSFASNDEDGAVG